MQIKNPPVNLVFSYSYFFIQLELPHSVLKFSHGLFLLPASLLYYFEPVYVAAIHGLADALM